MATEDTLVSSVTRTMVRTVVGCLVGLVLGVTALGVALGPGLWKDLALGVQSLGTTWEQGRSESAAADISADRMHRQVSRLSRQRDCSRVGFGPEVIPASAIVHVRGRVRSVSFDEGWAIHRGERPGRLLAVCRS